MSLYVVIMSFLHTKHLNSYESTEQILSTISFHALPTLAFYALLYLRFMHYYTCVLCTTILRFMHYYTCVLCTTILRFMHYYTTCAGPNICLENTFSSPIRIPILLFNQTETEIQDRKKSKTERNPKITRVNTR